MKLNLLILLAFLVTQQAFAIPHLTNGPRIIEPDLLNWGLDRKPSQTDLTEPTSNRINDIHSAMKQCDIVLSTSGNYHMALSELWYGEFLPHHPTIANWLYTTSPPISLQHAEQGELSVGNWRTECAPTVAVGPKGVMKKLKAAGLLYGKPIAVIKNQGNVLLVAKGNPKNITGVGDLARDDVTVVTSNPNDEPGSFGNYAGSIENMLRHAYGDKKAARYMARIFNSTAWVAGRRIHHREVPQIIADGRADAGMMFYHLARYVRDRFPHQFDIVPLGGTVDQPQALPGNKIATLYIARVGQIPRTGSAGIRANRLREDLIARYQSKRFTAILHKYGLKRPVAFTPLAIR